MTFFTRDLPQALARLRRSPGFALGATGVFALGLGAITLVFAVVYGVLFRALPYPNPDELVFLYESNPQRGIPSFSASPPNFVDWKRESKTLVQLAAFQTGSMTWTGGGPEAERISSAMATSDLLPMLGATPLAGRLFDARDFASAEPPTVGLISESFWRRRFGADPAAVGRTLTVNGRPVTIVGVLPETIRIPSPKMELVLPWVFSENEMANRGAKWLEVLGRRRPDADLAAVRAELREISKRLEAAHPDKNTGWTTLAEPAADDLVASSKRALYVLLGAVGVLFAIVCANVSSLAVVRAQARSDVAALRRALGATNGALVREKLAEMLAVALVGGVVGLVAARAGLRLFLAAGGADLPRQADIRFDLPVLLFGLAAIAAAAVLAALGPALLTLSSARTTSLAGAVAGGGSTRSAPRRARLRAAFVVGEVALTLVLLLGAGLLFRTLANLASVDPGFREREALSFRLRLAGPKYESPEARAALWRDLSSGLEELPGTRAAGGVTVLPLSGNDWTLSFLVVGRPDPEPGHETSAEYRVATPGYFEAIGMELVAGRLLGDDDVAGRPLVALVSETFVRRHFPGEDPLGKQLVIGDRTPEPRTIVGVVADVRQFTLAQESVPELYVPAAQKPPSGMSFVVRAGKGSSALAPAVRSLVARLDRDLPVYEVMSVGEYVDGALARPLLWTRLLALFSVLALILAAVGLYGVVAFSVAGRRRELGIRSALGAERRDLLGLVLGEAMRLGLVGVVVGVALALPAAKAIASQLYGVSPGDPLALGATCALLLLVCLAASLGPARRALGVDPAETLRAE